MEEDMDTYLGLTNPEASHWTPALKTHAQQLRMFRVRQPFPLLLAAHRMLAADQFAKVLRGCVVIAFRYNVIGNLPILPLSQIEHEEKIDFGPMVTPELSNRKVKRSLPTKATPCKHCKSLRRCKRFTPRMNPSRQFLRTKPFAPQTPATTGWCATSCAN